MSSPWWLSGLAATGAMGLVVVALRCASLYRVPRQRAGSLRPTGAAVERRAWLLVEALGRIILRRFGRPAGRREARRIGWAVLGALFVLFLAGPFLAVAIGALAGWAPSAFDRRRERERLGLMATDLPEVVDLLTLALSAGLNVSLAVSGVGSRASGALADELAQVGRETARGRRLADALDELPGRCGEAVRPLCTLLAAGERYGVPLIESLERLAVDVRASERRRAEEAARRLPVKMLFPLVVCILPAFGLLTLGPMLVTSFPSLTF